MRNLIEFIASFMETYICFSLLSLVFHKMSVSITIKKMIFTSILSSLIFILNHIELFSNYTLIGTMVMMVIISLFIYKEKILNIFCVVYVYYTIMVLFDIFGILILSIILGDEMYGMFLIDKFSTQRIVYIIIMKLLLILEYQLVKKYIFYIKQSIQYYAKWVIICTTCCFLGFLYFQRIGFFEIDNSFMVSWVLFLLAMVFMVSLISITIQYYKTKEKNDLICLKMNMMENSYQFQYRNQMINHDLTNHFSLLQKLIRNSEYQKAVEYIDEIGIFKQEEDYCSTGNEILDFVISSKIKEARNNGIDMDVECSTVNICLKDKDITSLFSNLLDNAIEACKLVEKENRWIKMQIGIINEMMLIVVSNSMHCKPRVIGKEFLSIKKEKGVHGLGMLIIKKIIKEYKGTIDINFNENVFNVRILL